MWEYCNVNSMHALMILPIRLSWAYVLVSSNIVFVHQWCTSKSAGEREPFPFSMMGSVLRGPAWTHSFALKMRLPSGSCQLCSCRHSNSHFYARHVNHSFWHKIRTWATMLVSTRVFPENLMQITLLERNKLFFNHTCMLIVRDNPRAPACACTETASIAPYMLQLTGYHSEKHQQTHWKRKENRKSQKSALKSQSDNIA